VADELDVARSWFPLGNLSTSGVEVRFQHIGRSAPNVSVSKDGAVGHGARECLNGSNSSAAIGSVVAQMGRVGCGEWPQSFVFYAGPMKSGRDHFGSGARCNESDSGFRNSILPFGSNAAAPDFVIVACNVVNEGLALEDSIVSVVGVDSHANIQPSFAARLQKSCGELRTCTIDAPKLEDEL